MGTIIRRNERSWAIVIISEIKVMLNGLGLKIKSAGGESTLSVNKKSMFPDVLLYEDEAQTSSCFLNGCFLAFKKLVGFDFSHTHLYL